MFTRLHPFRIVAAVLAALLLVGGLQGVADAATKRSVSITATPTVDAVKTSVTFAGKLTHSPKHSLVVIQRKSGKKWIKVVRTHTTATGAYSVKLTRPSAVAAYSYRAYSAKTRELKAATSKVIAVYALNHAFASLTATPSTLTVDSTTTLAGTVYPFIKGTGVILQKKTASTWLNVAVTTVTATGTFSKAVLVTGSATYRGIVLQAKSYAPTTTNERTVAAKPLILTTSLSATTRLGGYSSALKAYAGVAGAWSATGLPAGLLLHTNTGAITGSVTAPAADYTVTVGFTQTSTGLKAATKTYTLRVSAAAAPVISPDTLPVGSTSSPYSAQLTANASGTWSDLVGGVHTLPAGLTLGTSTGLISGTPTASGNSNVVITFARTEDGQTATKDYTLQVDPGTNPAPVIITSSLKAGKQFVVYDDTLQAEQADEPGTWTSGALPPGLTLNPTTGEITGTPTVAGDTAVALTFTRASDSMTATKTLHIVIAPADAPVISTTNLPDATLAQPYTTTLTVQGNVAGTWTADHLPAGLSLDPQTGVISGAPTVSGDVQVTIGFTQGNTGLLAAPKTLTLHVAEPPVISTAALPAQRNLVSYSFQLSVVGSPAGTWSATGLPSPLKVNASTGLITGGAVLIPATSNHTVTVKFTQTSTGLSTTKTFTLTSQGLL
ncbi:MAG TPA: putative Ig domain-containing protein, partial [Marmoricola sp.]|jgi:hypothetical protein|nr:putative Ig domain-containing protein [Marmoricola sp.]